MKRQSKLNKYLAGPKVNRRHTAQLKRNAYNRAIFMEELLRQNRISLEIKKEKVKLLKSQSDFEDVSEEILDAEFEDVKVD